MSDTATIVGTIWGDKLYQVRAREALPILIRQAEVGSKLFYSDLAEEMGMPNPRNLNYVLGYIGQTLMDLSEELGIQIPPIQCIVVNKANGLPGGGIGWFLDRSNLSGFGEAKFNALTQLEKRKVVDAELQSVFGFRRWPEVLSHLGLREAAATSIPKKALQHGEGAGMQAETGIERGGGGPVVRGQRHKRRIADLRCGLHIVSVLRTKPSFLEVSH